MVDDGSYVGPVRGHGGHVLAVGGGAGSGDEAGDEEKLLLLRQIAGIVHGSRTGGAPVAGHVHGEDIEARFGEEGHPAVVLEASVEGDFGWGARAVDEQDDLVWRDRPAKSRTGDDDFPDVDLGGLADDGRNGGFDGHMVVDAQQSLPVVGKQDR